MNDVKPAYLFRQHPNGATQHCFTVITENHGPILRPIENTFYDCNDIPAILEMFYHAAEISPVIKSVVSIDIPLHIKKHHCTLRLTLNQQNNIDNIELCHYPVTLDTPEKVKALFKKPIEKNLQYFDKSIQLLSDPYVLDNNALLTPTWTDSCLLREKPQLPHKTELQKNEIILPPDLSAFKLKDLTDKTLTQLHYQYKNLKIQRLWNKGRGNYYQQCTARERYSVPSKLFLAQLENILIAQKPVGYGFIKFFIKNAFTDFDRISKFYTQLDKNYGAKKQAQEKPVKRLKLEIRDPMRHGRGNIARNLSLKSYQSFYSAFKRRFKKASDTLPDKEEAIAHNRAHMHAINRTE